MDGGPNKHASKAVVIRIIVVFLADDVDIVGSDESLADSDDQNSNGSDESVEDGAKRLTLTDVL